MAVAAVDRMAAAVVAMAAAVITDRMPARLPLAVTWSQLL
jgi:hypothetical protein